MKIEQLKKELDADTVAGSEDIFVKRGDFLYDFFIGIDDNGKSIICLLPRTIEQEV